MPRIVITKQLRCGLQYVVRGLVALDHVLRPGEQQNATVGKPPVTPSASALPSIRKVVLVVIACGIIYGTAMGSYAFVANHRSLWQQLPQMIYSATKVPLLLAITVAVSLPSFFVLNSLFGLRAEFGEVIRAVVAAQAGMTIILASLAPLTLFVYVFLEPGTAQYNVAVLFNAFIFGIASVSAQLLLRRYYQPLIRINRRHRSMMRLWIVVYAFVGIQAGYILRPFIGNPEKPTSFLRSDSFQNAYVRLLEIFIELLH